MSYEFSSVSSRFEYPNPYAVENIFRGVNIALVNELKVVYAAMGIDVWEVIDAAKTKPFGFQAFYPGPGLCAAEILALWLLAVQGEAARVGYWALCAGNFGVRNS